MYASLLELFGLGTSAGQASPYHMTPRAVADNLLTYLGWTADFGVVTVNHFADVVDPEAREQGVDGLSFGRRCHDRLQEVEGVHEAVGPEQARALGIAAHIRGQEGEEAVDKGCGTLVIVA